MKTIRLLSITLLAVLFFASCDSDDSSPDVGTTPVAFAPTISGAQATTRASGSAWAANDTIGIFMKTVGKPLSGNNIADNVQYTTNGTKFTGSPIYYPQGSNVDFIAYYPYRTTPNPDPYIYKVDVSAQTTPAAIDLLWSANATNVARSKTAVPLTFDHKLSQIVLTIAKGEGMTTTNLLAMSITIEGMPTKADFKLADGMFDIATDIATITPRTVTAGTTYDAILIPQTGTTGRKMIFTVGTDEYEYPISASDGFASGKSYPYTVTVKKTGVSVSRGTITDWIDTGSIEDIGSIEQIHIPMVLIPAGTFLMGSPTTDVNTYDDERPQHWVKLTKDFYMSKYQITNAQYAAFLNANSIDSEGKGSITYYNDTLMSTVTETKNLSMTMNGV